MDEPYEDNRAIRYNDNSLKILQLIVMVMLKTIC